MILGLIQFIFFFFIIIIVIALVFVVNLLFRFRETIKMIWHTTRDMKRGGASAHTSSNAYGNNTGYDNASTSQQSTTGNPDKRKIFAPDEGEYVDFEEVKD